MIAIGYINDEYNFTARVAGIFAYEIDCYGGGSHGFGALLGSSQTAIILMKYMVPSID